MELDIGGISTVFLPIFLVVFLGKNKVEGAGFLAVFCAYSEARDEASH
jgi:hypothetical protein